jgi:APA family basic amino acid/polyamine antiporter
MPETSLNAAADPGADADRGFVRGLGLFDSVMIVAGVMIGSGIFIVPAEIARETGSAGGLLAAWCLTGALTITAALCYGELAAMIPHAGGMYVYLREAFSPLWGFLYGWTLFTVIQTGTIAAVSVAFARYLGVLWPAIAEDRYLIAPRHLSANYAVSLSTAQLVAVGVIALLSWTNSRGLDYGRMVQNVFTSAKVAALFGLIGAGLLLGWRAAVVHANFSHAWRASGYVPLRPGVAPVTLFGLLAAIAVAQSGALFSADSWHDVTFAAAEVRDPRRTLPRALALGATAVIALYLLANVSYLAVLPLAAIQQAGADRVATAMLRVIFPGAGEAAMALAIMLSTFGCVNSLVLAGPRAYYVMAQDRLFFLKAGRLNAAHVPGWSIAAQGVWAVLLVLPRTFDPQRRTYGNLYSNLLDYVISSALIFYILTIAGLIRLRRRHPEWERPFRVPAYPLLPLAYVAGASVVLAALFAYRPHTTWPGLVIVAAGVPVYWLLRRRGPTDSAASDRA